MVYPQRENPLDRGLLLVRRLTAYRRNCGSGVVPEELRIIHFVVVVHAGLTAYEEELLLVQVLEKELDRPGVPLAIIAQGADVSHHGDVPLLARVHDHGLGLDTPVALGDEGIGGELPPLLVEFLLTFSAEADGPADRPPDVHEGVDVVHADLLLWCLGLTYRTGLIPRFS